MQIHPSNRQVKTAVLVVVILLLGSFTFVLSSALQKKSGPTSPVTTFQPKAAPPAGQNNKTYTRFITISTSSPASPSATPAVGTSSAQLTSSPTPTPSSASSVTPSPTIMANSTTTTPTPAAISQVVTTSTPTPAQEASLPTAGYMQYLTIIFIAAVATIAVSLLF